MDPAWPAVELGRRLWQWKRTCVFGVLNVTPDSFSDGGQFLAPEAALAQGLALLEQGADVLDIGGESTRPGSTPVAADEELCRVLPVITALAQRTDAPISIDTYKAEVARAALQAGAAIVNDVSGLRQDPELAAVVAEQGAVIVIGHLRGEPATMQRCLTHRQVVPEVIDELKQQVRVAVAAGVAPSRIWVDPGLGFGKSAAQSIELLKSVGRLRDEIGYPLLVGPSRKSFVGSVTGEPVDGRLMGTAAATVAAIVQGADAVRLHDVGQLASAVKMADALRRATRDEGYRVQ